ncbi:hypothetical protein BDN72DRAFT_86878 [Pluteus cervinus]|uniref:Uncharacterized protein n=1 Tax=Pluteus cervinus TaxID=181527 RepID=A0ACD3AQ53_9AGAR|nr:hypothetical protein BDN72DRAFT_86878 [Pluteus cervinus]
MTSEVYNTASLFDRSFLEAGTIYFLVRSYPNLISSRRISKAPDNETVMHMHGRYIDVPSLVSYPMHCKDAAISKVCAKIAVAGTITLAITIRLFIGFVVVVVVPGTHRLPATLFVGLL